MTDPDLYFEVGRKYPEFEILWTHPGKDEACIEVVGKELKLVDQDEIINDEVVDGTREVTIKLVS